MPTKDALQAELDSTREELVKVKGKTGRVSLSKREERKPIEKPLRFFIINPSGTMHEVDQEHARWRLGQLGWTMATKEQVVEFLKVGGNQTAKSPLFEPFSPDPEGIEMPEGFSPSDLESA